MNVHSADRHGGELRRRSLPELARDARHLVGLHRAYRAMTPVFVYTMGKVASTAIRQSIQRATGDPVLQFHYMTKTEQRRVRTWALNHGEGFARQVWLRGEYARYRVRLASLSRRRIDAITAVRDPVALQVSALFQLGERFGYLRDNDPAATARYFERLYRERLHRDWFETEFRPATGLDVYARPFPHDRGWTTVENDRFRVLLLRHEDLHQAPDVLGEFLGTQPVPLSTANVTEEKASADLYRRFVQERYVPRWIIEDCYSSRLAGHFYSDEERERFRAQWLEAR